MPMAGPTTPTWRVLAAPDRDAYFLRPGYCPPGPSSCSGADGRAGRTARGAEGLRRQLRQCRRAAIQQPRAPHVDRVVALVDAGRLHHEGRAERQPRVAHEGRQALRADLPGADVLVAVVAAAEL